MESPYQLGEIVEVELAGNWIKGRIIYSEHEGILDPSDQWMLDQKLEGICVRWQDPEFANSLVSLNPNQTDLADFIHITDNFEEEVRPIVA